MLPDEIITNVGDLSNQYMQSVMGSVMIMEGEKKSIFVGVLINIHLGLP